MSMASLPAWGCGLKFSYIVRYTLLCHVTPCVGVWIEIIMCVGIRTQVYCHSLRGGVD